MSATSASSDDGLGSAGRCPRSWCSARAGMALMESGDASYGLTTSTKLWLIVPVELVAVIGEVVGATGARSCWASANTRGALRRTFVERCKGKSRHTS